MQVAHAVGVVTHALTASVWQEAAACVRDRSVDQEVYVLMEPCAAR